MLGYSVDPFGVDIAERPDGVPGEGSFTGQFARDWMPLRAAHPEKVPAVGEDGAMAKRIRGLAAVIYKQTWSVPVIQGAFS